jgi:hypothetical protein
VIHLYNFHDHIELPEPEEYLQYGTGVNISANKINREIVEMCHAKGMRVGVWVDTAVFAENSRFYNNMIKIGVDFLVTDYPLVAIEARDLQFSAEKVKSSTPDSCSDLVRTNSKYKSYSQKSLDNPTIC